MKRTPIERLVRAHKFGTGAHFSADEIRELFTAEPGHAVGWATTVLGYRLKQAAEAAEFARTEAAGGDE
ncbi:MAG: hypothetical protein OXC08_20725 [Thiotrichales bacterium]|nr:hypothetical protein [Thiotrichales bacterium]